ncbi:MAG: allophanate hydrolase subunit 1 [Pseudomonadota bacterium]
MTEPSYKAVGDSGLLVEFGSKVDDALNKIVLNLDSAILDAKIDGVTETVPALVNLLVVFDPLATDHKAVEREVRKLIPVPDKASGSGKVHEIPVCYDPELCPDLTAVAAATNLSVDQVIDFHSNSQMSVSMFGFAPGAAYLTGLPDAIQVPRKPQPVRGVPGGSVIIAGPQCIITPFVMPTGWSIIGRSPVEVLQMSGETSFLFDVGDTVTFKPVGRLALPSALQVP